MLTWLRRAIGRFATRVLPVRRRRSTARPVGTGGTGIAGAVGGAGLARHGSIGGASARCRMLAEADAQAGALVLGMAASEDAHAPSEAGVPSAAPAQPDRPGRLQPALNA